METSSVTHAAAQKGLARTGHDAGPESAKKSAVTDQQKSAATDFGEAVEIQVSDGAEDASQASGPGKSAQSPAHQARAFLAERAAAAQSGSGEKVPFGQIVSRIARGLDPAEAFTAPAEGAEEGAEEGGAPEDEDEVEAAEGGAVVGAPAEGTSETGSDGLVADLIEELVEDDEETA